MTDYSESLALSDLKRYIVERQKAFADVLFAAAYLAVGVLPAADACPPALKISPQCSASYGAEAVFL